MNAWLFGNKHRQRRLRRCHCQQRDFAGKQLHFHGEYKAHFGGSAIEIGSGDTTIDNSTISSKFTGRFQCCVVAAVGGTVAVRNTIIVGNDSSDSYSDVSGTFISEGYNLIGTTSAGGSGFGSTGDQIGASAAQVNLGPLQDNGGPTLTMKPGPGSVAIDQGKRGLDANNQPINTDQRGQPRPVDLAGPNAVGGDGSDIGAVEGGLPQTGSTFIVTNTSEHDDGNCTNDDCTLLEALNAANANADANTITFAPGVIGTIPNSVTVGLAITNPVTIVGPGAQILAVAGKTGTRVFNVTGANVRISGLTMKDATSGFNGGGITNSGQLTLSDCVISNNHNSGSVGSELDGGGIYNSAGATLTLTRCVLSGNGAQSYGGAVYNSGTVAATDCSFSTNTAGVHGGAFWNNGAAGNANLTLTNCTLNANSCSGSGGAIFSSGYNSGHATATLTNCTLDHNVASQYGGAIYSDGTENGNAALTVTNCTFNQNSASLGFGGIAIDGMNNNSTGIATLLIRNTILRSGASGNNLNNDGGSITSGGYNLSNDSAGGDAAKGPGGLLNATGDQRNTDPLLDTLKNNGGTTNTVALLAGSPAINAGNDANAPSTDQRGYFRTGVSDIGAFEFNGVVPLPPTVTTGPATNITSTTATLNATVNPNGLDTSVQFTSNFRSFGGQAAGSGTNNISISVDVTGLAPNTQYTFNMTVTNSAGTTQGVQQSFTTLPPTTLANISTRLRVETGDNVLIGGFIVTGTQSKKVMIRAIGPSLPFPDDLADPILELHDSSGALLDSNDNWVDSPNKQAIIDTTIAPTNDLESAIVATLPANSSGYTAIVRGVNNGTGIGVVEAYDLDRTVDSKLANISTRGLVQTGDDVLIAGTIVVGQAPQKVMVEALGPSLSVPGKLEDPILELRDGNGGLVDSNDNWIDSPNKQAIIDSTIPPTNDFESAIIATLPAGGAQYTAIVRGVNGTTGIAVVEVFALN